MCCWLLESLRPTPFVAPDTRTVCLAVHGYRRRLANEALWDASGGLVVESGVDRKRGLAMGIRRTYPYPSYGGAGPVAAGLKGHSGRIADPTPLEGE